MTRIKRREPEIYKLGTKEILYSLESEYQWLDLLRGKNKAYEPLLDIIEREGRRNEDDDFHNPSIKSIASELGELSATVTKWLNKIYAKLNELNLSSPELFKSSGNPYHLRFQNTITGQLAIFTLWIEQPLVYMQRFQFGFINAMIGESEFFVSEVRTEHSKGKIQTMILLKSGYFNYYRETLLATR